MPRIGPYSRTLHRGVIGGSLDGRSAEAKYLRAFEAEMVRHIGGAPTFAQKMLIGRLARTALRLELFDRKMSEGAF